MASKSFPQKIKQLYNLVHKAKRLYDKALIVIEFLIMGFYCTCRRRFYTSDHKQNTTVTVEVSVNQHAMF